MFKCADKDFRKHTLESLTPGILEPSCDYYHFRYNQIFGLNITPKVNKIHGYYHNIYRWAPYC